MLRRHFGDAEEFQVAKEGSGAGSADIVCYQKSLSLKCCACCSCLAARGCAEVQDSVTRLDGDAGGGGHGAGFLKVVEAGLVVWASGRTDVFIVEVAVFDPWDLTGWKWRQVFEVFAGDLGGVYAQAVGSGALKLERKAGYSLPSISFIRVRNAGWSCVVFSFIMGWFPLL